MDILLTHGYFLNEDEAEKRVMKPYPALGILYLSSYLKSRGFAVEVFDSTFQSPEHFKRYIASAQPPVVGISINLMTKLNALRMIRWCKEQGSAVVVGGPEVPWYAEEFLRYGVDVAVIGEGEHTLAELLPLLLHGRRNDLGHVAGIAYLAADGTVIRTTPRPLISDLDALPFPDREAIPIQPYVDTWKAYHGRSSLSLLCARGCPYSCTWCSRSVFGETHRRRSVHKVVDEIELLLDRYRPDQVWFADDVFTINYRWLFAFAEEMRRRNLRVPFECITRADRLNEDVVRTLAELGALRVWFGSESGSQRILDAMQRRVSVEEIRTATAMLQRYGIEAGLFVMLGYPGEDLSDIDATIEHLKQTRPDVYLTTIAYPIKGTPMYDEVKDRLETPGDWSTSTDRATDFAGRYSQRFYWFAIRHLANEVRWHSLLHNGNGNRNLLSLLSAFTKAKAARLGMRLTAYQRSTSR